MNAWGFIETIGFIPAIAAADSMAKAANIQVVGTEMIAGAMITVAVKGDIADVTVAVDAGASAAKRNGKLVCAHVIARPNAGADKVLKLKMQD